VTRDDFRRRADAVRSIPLDVVLTRWGAARDRRDRAQWRTEQGPLTVTGIKFFNWHCHQGSGGAIDLVMHLSGWEVGAAVKWLEQLLGSSPAAASPASRGAPGSSSGLNAPCQAGSLHLPAANRFTLEGVRRYLTERRGLAPHILQPLIDAGKLYADQRGNAVFLMVIGKPNRPIGAELRGTGRSVWRGLARGTRKDLGYFWIGAQDARQIVICESAIDAISCFQMNLDCICISTAGVRSDPPWLRPLITRGYDIYCGFDDDQAGNAAAQRMMAHHSSIKRLQPPAHDWNDALTTSR
jgi:hypothetical protein